MALDGGTAIVNVIANGAGLSSQIAAATKTGVGKATGVISAGFGVALAAAGIAAVKLASDFQTSMNKIQALVGVSAAEVERLSASVLNLSTQVAVAPKELADALFFIESAGQRGATAMNTLKLAAKAAASGLGSTATVADAVTSAMNAYATSGLTAASATDIMIAAVKAGKLPPEDLAASLGQVLPVAAAMGVSFDQVAAAIASSTREGLNAARAATGVRFLLSSFAKPSSAAVTALHGISMSTQELQHSLADRGLLATLEMLSKRFDLSSAAGKQAFATIVGGARGLSVASILVGQNAAAVGKIFGDVTNSSGSLGAAFEAVSHTVGFQMKQAFADIQVTLIRLGDAVLPTVAGLLKTVSDALVTAAPLFKVAADNATLLLTALALYKGLTFLPILLGGIATQLGALAVVADSGAIDAVAVSIGVAGSAAARASLGTIALAYGIGSISSVAQTSTTDMQHLNEGVTFYTNALAAGTVTRGQFQAFLEGNVPALHGNAEAFKLAVTSGISYNDALFQLNLNMPELDRHTFSLSHNLDELAKHTNKAGNEVRNFAGLSKPAFAEFRKAVVDSVQVAIGDFSKLSDAFKTTPAELAKQAALAVQIARRERRDLAAIFGSKDLSDKQKQALAGLPADLRDAWARGTAAQKDEIAKGAHQLAQLNKQNFHQITTDAKQQLSTGGKSAGKGLTDGVSSGISSGSGNAVARAHQLGLDVVAALKAAMGVHSPSTEGIKIGQSLIDGIVKGIEQRSSKVQDALKALVPLLHEALGVGAADQARGFLDDFSSVERKLRELTKEFDKLKSKISDFRGAIRGAFAQFADLLGPIGQQLADFASAQSQFATDQASFLSSQVTGGTPGTAPVAPTAPDLHAIVAAQVAGAQQLAKDLLKLQESGLNKALLAELAAQGANAIPIAEQLLGDPALIQQLNDAQQQIADITQTTANKLTTAAFGDKLAKLAEDFTKLQGHFDTLLSRLQRFIQGLGFTTERLKTESDALVQALQQLNNALQGAGANVGPGNGGGNGPGNGGNGTPQWTPAWHPAWQPAWQPGNGAGATTVVVNVNAGALVHQNDLPAFIRDQLLDLQRRNITTGL